jgi:hypothetical protein
MEGQFKRKWRTWDRVIVTSVPTMGWQIFQVRQWGIRNGALGFRQEAAMIKTGWIAQKWPGRSGEAAAS